MLIAAQFPCSPLWKEIEDINPSATSRIHTRLFSIQAIDPNIVTAIYKLLKIDKQSILKFVPLWEQQYILRVLCIVVPKEKYNLPGFGMFRNDQDDDNCDDNGEGDARKQVSKKSGGGKRSREENESGKNGKKNSKSVLSKKVTLAGEYSTSNVNNNGVGIKRGKGRPVLSLQGNN